MRTFVKMFLAVASLLLCSGNVFAACPAPGCPSLAGNPVPASCSGDVCNTHVFFTDQAGRILDLEKNLVDYGWPCPGKCPVWDSSTKTYVRQYSDLGWKLNQVTSDTGCDNVAGTPAYSVDDQYRMLAAVTQKQHLVVWTSPSSCCRQCAVDSDSACTCTLTPAADECDPPECNCECPDSPSCEPWPTDQADLSPTCGCSDTAGNTGCCWQPVDLSAASGIKIKGNPAFSGRDIFARAEYDHIIHFWFSDGAWHWADLTNDVTGRNTSISDDPASLKDENGVQYVVFRAGNGHLIGLVWNGAWQWFDLTLLAGGNTIHGRPAIIYNNSTGTGHIFARGADSQLFEWWWNNVDGLRFANVTALCNHSIAGNPSACLCNGGISVVFRDSSDHLVRITKSCQDQTTWRCEDLTEAGCGRLIAGDPACFATNDGSSVFASTRSGRLLRWVNSGNGWLVTDMFMDIGCPNDLGMHFAFMPAGSFNMGSPVSEYGRDYDEGPAHRVVLTDPFYMQTTEVTQAQFQAVMGYNPSGNQGCANCPVENVTWSAAQKFVAAMNMRCEGAYSIPTEAEWEYSARAGSDTAWYFGDNLFSLPGYAWFLDNSWETSHPVALKTPNSWGLYDMYGNVAEWVADAYAEYSAADQVNPFAVDDNWIHSVRGGSWKDPDNMQRSASRHYSLRPESMQPYIGIRLKRTTFGN